MAYTSIENSAEIQALKQQYTEAQAAGASKDVLNSIHQAAEALRKAAGYESTDNRIYNRRPAAACHFRQVIK